MAQRLCYTRFYYMTIKFRPNKKEYILFNLRAFIGSTGTRLVLGALFLFIFLTGIDFTKGTIILLLTLFMSALLAVFLALITLLISATFTILQMLVRIKSNKTLFDQDITYSFEKERIISQDANSKSEWSWNAIKKVKQTNQAFFLHLSSIRPVMIFIPKRAFTSRGELDEFVTLLKEKGLL